MKQTGGVAPDQSGRGIQQLPRCGHGDFSSKKSPNKGIKVHQEPIKKKQKVVLFGRGGMRSTANIPRRAHGPRSRPSVHANSDSATFADRPSVAERCLVSDWQAEQQSCLKQKSGLKSHPKRPVEGGD